MDEFELILTDICKCSRAELYSGAFRKVLNGAQIERLEKILKKRGRAVPVQYGLGYADFMGLVFKVNKRVLIPRPETEQLVEAALEIVSAEKNDQPACRILDIGTGSGCIAIALAKYCRRPTDIVALDISPEALEVAYENAVAHSVEKKMRFLESDVCTHAFFAKEPVFDLIVSNPPYVPFKEIGQFDPTTTREPRIALDGGRDGCSMYRRLSKEVLAHLAEDGVFIFELGAYQSDTIRDIFSDGWKIERFISDYNGFERICIARARK